MFCMKCGKEIANDTRFCTHCGAPVDGGVNVQSGQSIPQPMTQPILKKKSMKGLIIGICVAICVIFGGIVSYNVVCSVMTTESRVEGVWERDTIYLSSYGCSATLYTYLYYDGSYMEILFEANNPYNILDIEYGYWHIEGSDVVLTEPGVMGETHLKYNPFMDTFKNGDNTYRRID